MLKIIFTNLPKLRKSIEGDNYGEDVFLEKPVHPTKLLMILEENKVPPFVHDQLKCPRQEK
jgi:hypothetical protein